MPGSLAAGRCSNYRAECLVEPGLWSSESGGAEKTQHHSHQSSDGAGQDAAQCVHLVDGETEASKEAVTQREEHGHRTECGGLL